MTLAKAYKLHIMPYMREGKIVEYDLLGETKKDIATFGQLHEIESYMKRREAINFVKSHQRGKDPHNPTRFFPRNLVEGIREDEGFGISAGDEVSFYTAVNSPLDRYHGVDAFFEFKIGGKEVMVTIDVTTNPNKDNYKADVILAIPSGGLDPSDPEYKDIVSHYVEQIISEALTKLVA